MSYLCDGFRSYRGIVYCAVLLLVNLRHQRAGVSAKHIDPTRAEDDDIHVVPFYHVQTQRDHLDPCVCRVLPLHAVRQDEVGPHVKALELALEGWLGG